MVVSRCPVSALLAEILASGTPAPLESVTVPPRLVPVYCAVSGTARHNSNTVKATIAFFFIVSSTRFDVQ
jgi:hypothetical protein